ncbi:glycosyltransferase family 9 protein [Rugosimonospora acidiphila]|uniref:Glycosyltransferase family 9 protein n=1 Tax=Rugosimonospora acidiphila TaxID=556531 RepID=A0ABP9RQI8_9ACTN
MARIAVLRANAVGDFIFTLPALDALRAAYPDAEITLLGAPWHARFLTGRPGPVDDVVVVPPLPGIRTADAGEQAPSLPEFQEAVRARRYDVAVQLHGGGRNSNPFVLGLGARLAIGLRAPDAPALDRWVRYDYYQPEVFRYLEVVGLIGASPVGWRPRLELTEQDLMESKAVAGVPAGPRVALHPGASDTRRRWPARRFSEVGDALAEAGAEVIVTGTPPEREVVEEVVGQMRRPARALVGGLSLGGLAALYAGCAAVVSNDTGPLHLAEAVDTPTVGIYWIGNLINCAPPERTRHLPMISWTIHCPECGLDCTRDLYPARDGATPCEHRVSFVADVPSVEVRDAALELLGRAAVQS